LDVFRVALQEFGTMTVQPSLKLIQATNRIRALIEARADRPLAPDEFAAQCESFIVGNAYDIFADPKTITVETVRRSKSERLLVGKP
jgi:hypothetical protein